jgi:PAS domain S-box-containing protein
MSGTSHTTDPPFLATVDRLGVGVAFALSGVDAERRFTYMSPAWADLAGVGPETVLADAQAFYGALPSEDRERLAAAEAESAKTLNAFDLEVVMQAPDRRARFVRIFATPERQADGAVVWNGLILDETERREAERDAERDRWRVEMAAEAAGIGFWELDISTGELYWAARTRALFGLSPATAVSATRYDDSIHADDQEIVRSAFRAACKSPDDPDFSAEFRIKSALGAVKWVLMRGRVLFDGGVPRQAVGTMFDITARRGLEEQRMLVMGELSHRTRNSLAYLMAMAQQIGRQAHSVEEYRDALMGRFQAMARSQELLTEANGQALHLPDLLTVALEPFGADRFDVSENLEDVRLTDGLARGLALLFHELGTNALKYGALSTADGRVRIWREPEPAGVAVIHWREQDGPPVSPPGKAGFGSRLLEHALRQQGGRVVSQFEPDGFVARMEFPLPA